MRELLTIFQGVGAMALITITYGTLQRMPWPQWKRHLFIGFAFGAGAAYAMLDPIVIGPGVFFDTRDLFIAFSGAFLGPLGAATALLVAGTTRLVLGGAGAGLGVISMLMAGLIGLMWMARTLRPKVLELHHFGLMGLHVSLALVVVALLPADQLARAMQDALPFLLFFNVVGALAFGTLLERERGLARRERKLIDRADRDFLTRVLNRRGFDRAYERARASAGQAGNAVLLVDFDRFKLINDTYGHGVGDEVLLAAAQAMEEALRPNDLLARIGGEEFAVLLTDVSEYEAYRIAEALRQAVLDGVRIRQAPKLRVTASVGGAYLPGGMPPLYAVLEEADMGLYAAKSRGRDRTVMSPAAAA